MPGVLEVVSRRNGDKYVYSIFLEMGVLHVGRVKKPPPPGDSNQIRSRSTIGESQCQSAGAAQGSSFSGKTKRTWGLSQVEVLMNHCVLPGKFLSLIFTFLP